MHLNYTCACILIPTCNIHNNVKQDCKYSVCTSGLLKPLIAFSIASPRVFNSTVSGILYGLLAWLINSVALLGD